MDELSRVDFVVPGLMIPLPALSHFDADSIHAGRRIGGLEIAQVSPNFLEQFGGIVEYGIGTSNLLHLDILESMADYMAIYSLGGEGRACMMLARMFQTIEYSSNNSQAYFDGKTNVHYVRVGGRLCAAFWYVQFGQLHIGAAQGPSGRLAHLDKRHRLFRLVRI